MSMSRFQAPFLLAVIGGVASLGFFVGVFGTDILDPSNVSWLLVPPDSNLQMDKPYAFLGWHYFRYSDWALPLGSIQGYFDPFKVNVAYSDSVPWLAVVAKAFVPNSMEPFQYAGLWLAACFALQGYYAVRLMQALTKDLPTILIGTTLIATAPVLLFRLDHLALCAHWLVLAAIAWSLKLQSYPQKEQRYPRTATLWYGAILAPLACATHPYLGAMVSTLVLFQYFFNRSLKKRWMPAVSLVVANGIILVLFGYVPSLVDDRGGSHYYAADVFTFFNSMGRSALLPGFRTWGGQYEGFAYLGLGVLLSLLCYVWLLRRQRLLRHKFGQFLRSPLGLAAIGLFLFALSYHVRFFSKWIISLDWIYKPLEPLTTSFRSAGRFSWPLSYVLIAISVVWLRPHFNRPKLWLLLTLIVSIQIWDQWSVWSQTGFSSHFSKEPYANLEGYIAKQEEIRLIPPFINYHECGNEAYPRGYLQAIAFFAAPHQIRLNSGSIANLDPELAASHCKAEIESFLQSPKEKVSYLIGKSWAVNHEAHLKDFNCSLINDYLFCTKGLAKLSRKP